MSERIEEGLLFDLISKRRAGQFTGDEILWAVDHMGVVRWAMANLATMEGLRKGDLVAVKRGPLVTTYDQSLGLRALIERAVGEGNLGNINPDITPQRFPLAGEGVRQVNLRVEPYRDNETSEQAAARLTAAGHTIADTGDLAGFLHDHPEEVERWGWVLAISEGSRWAYSDGRVCVPDAGVDGAYRRFDLRGFRSRLYSGFGVLVFSESAGT